MILLLWDLIEIGRAFLMYWRRHLDMKRSIFSHHDVEHLLLAEVEFAAYLAVNLRSICDLFTGKKSNEDCGSLVELESSSASNV